MSTTRGKKSEFPMAIDRKGVTAKIYKSTQTRGGTDYTTFMVSYTLLGERKMKGFAELADAVAHAEEACDKLADGQQRALELNNNDSATYLRALGYLKPINVPLDVAARDHADVLQILAGRASAVEVARDWVKRNATSLPLISVADAVEKLKAQIKTDGKSQQRQQQIAAALDRFSENMVCNVHTLAPTIVSQYLTALPFAEKTKRNHRDALGYLSRWLVLRGYLPKGAELLEGVQKYSGRKFGKITTYTADVMAKLLIGAQKADKRMVPSLALGAFAQMRTAEIARIDRRQIDFDGDGRNSKSEPQIVVESEIAKNGAEGEADRTIQMKDNLRAWLEPYCKSTGKVCPFSEKQIAKHWKKIAEAAGVPWKKNALRHSCISARIAECRDVPRVADESGNSPSVIRTNYRKQNFKERDAARWFAITPENVAKIAAGETLPDQQKIVKLPDAAKLEKTG